MFNEVKKELITDIKNIYNNHNVIELNIEVEKEQTCYIYLNIKQIRRDNLNNKQYKYYVEGELSTIAGYPCNRSHGYFLDGYNNKDLLNLIPNNRALTINHTEFYNLDIILINFRYESKVYNIANCNVGNIKDINIESTITNG